MNEHEAQVQAVVRLHREVQDGIEAVAQLANDQSGERVIATTKVTASLLANYPAEVLAQALVIEASTLLSQLAVEKHVGVHELSDIRRSGLDLFAWGHELENPAPEGSAD